MTKYSRWYDRYPDLKSLLQLLKNLDEYTLELISQDFIQIITGQYKEKFDTVIANLSENAPSKYQRWYDKNYNLHTSIEFIKMLDNDKERNQLINSFIFALLSFTSSNDNV